MKLVENPVQKRRSRGFTLVELLVTISIMATVAGMFLVAYRGAATEASNIKTQSTIRKISEVLTARVQEFENYTVDFLTPIPGDANLTFSADSPTILRERLRLLGLRELMCLELPDHPDDIKWTVEWQSILSGLSLLDGDGFPSTKFRDTGLFRGNAPGPPGAAVPPIRIKYSGRAKRLLQKLSVPGAASWQPLPNWEVRNANAELLFLIVEDATFNGSSAIELFGRTEIADTDGDGLNEFIDAYRRPIRWIRWPSGYQSVVRAHPDMLDPNMFDKATGTYRANDDQFDRMRADPGYSNALTSKVLLPDVGTTPLVASAGPDGLFGIRFELPPHLPEYPADRRDPSIPKPEPDLGSSNEYSVMIPQYPGYSLMKYGTRVSHSAGDVLFTTDYGSIVIADPWFPRPKAANITMDDRLLFRFPDTQGNFNEMDQDLRNDYPSTYRLGGVMKCVPEGLNGDIFKKVGADDITNYEITGAYQ